MTRFRFTFTGLALAVAILVAAQTASATTATSVGSSFAGVAAATAKPRATVKLSQCVGSPQIDSRKIVFTARTWIHGESTLTSQKRQMRFDLYRKFDEQKKYRRVRASGLSVWTTENLNAVIDERELALNGLDTEARFFVKVSFRWYDAAGTTIVAKREIASKTCALKDRLPDPIPLNLFKSPVAGSNDALYRIPIRNRGGSEAAKLPLLISVDGGPAITGAIETLLKGDTVLQSFRAPWCAQNVSVKFDPARAQRIAKRARQVFTLPC